MMHHFFCRLPIVKYTIFLYLILTVYSCAIYTLKQRLYEGPDLPIEKIAML